MQQVTSSAQAGALALSATLIFAPKPPPSQPPRRHLAQNVACMFDDDRPPVTNARRRGRLPHNVTRFAIPPFAVGQVVELFYGDDSPNNGKRVRITGHDPESGRFYVEAVSDLIETYDLKTLQPCGLKRCSSSIASEFRRIPKLSSQGSAA